MLEARHNFIVRGAKLAHRFPCVLLAGGPLILLALAGCGGATKQGSSQPAQASEAQPQQEATPAYTVVTVPGGTIEGRVLFKGKLPSPKTVVVNQDPGVCGAKREVFPVRVAKGGIVDAVVWLDDVQRGKPFAFPNPVLQQRTCTYEPHIVLMPPGELRVDSGDPVPHNIHTYAEFGRDYNESMNQLRRSLTLSFVRPERVSVKCDLHGWMQAYVVVAKNPYYAVTREQGTFQLANVPPGRYHLKVWQESLGEMEQEVEVEAGKTAKVDFTFEAKAGPTVGGQ
jgi:hypothetical protein